VTDGGVRVALDVVYSRPVGYRPLSLDLYQPAAATDVLCLYLHGGGWRVGSRSDGPGASFFARVASLGMAIASVDYRLSGEATFPAQSDDVRAAVEFLGDLGIGTRLVAWGVSAGGHLAALQALDVSGPRFAAVACWYAPTDLRALPDDIDAAGGVGDRGPGARESQLIGAALAERPDLADAASPVKRVHAGAPPFLLLHGDADRFVPHVQSERMASALTAVGASATVELVPEAGHQLAGVSESVLDDLVDRTVRFLSEAGS
jgi:acetyl esterase/lipase